MWALNSRIAICFHSGFLLFQLMDLRTASAVLVMAFLELSLMGWLYGAGPFMKHIKVSLEMYLCAYNVQETTYIRVQADKRTLHTQQDTEYIIL